MVHSPHPESPSLRTSTNSYAALPGFAEAGGEGVDQGHAELAQDNRFNLHEHLFDIGCSGCEEPRRLLPSPELKNPVALCIHPKANHRKLARERLFKMLAIPALDVKNTVLIHRRVPPMSYLMRYCDFLLHSGKSDRFAAQGGANPITIQPPFRVEPISGNLTMQTR